MLRHPLERRSLHGRNCFPRRALEEGAPVLFYPPAQNSRSLFFFDVVRHLFHSKPADIRSSFSFSFSSPSFSFSPCRSMHVVLICQNAVPLILAVTFRLGTLPSFADPRLKGFLPEGVLDEFCILPFPVVERALGFSERLFPLLPGLLDEMSWVPPAFIFNFGVFLRAVSTIWHSLIEYIPSFYPAPMRPFSLSVCPGEQVHKK